MRQAVGAIAGVLLILLCAGTSTAQAFFVPEHDFFYNETFVTYPIDTNGTKSVQSALKSGDTFSLRINVTSFSNKLDAYLAIENAAADLSSLGLGSTVEFVEYNRNGLFNYEFVLQDMVLPPGVETGMKEIALTITDEMGNVGVKRVTIMVDNTPPILQITPNITLETPLKPSYTIPWSGVIDATGTTFKWYGVTQEQIAEDGTTVVAQRAYVSPGDEAQKLRELGNGAFSNVSLILNEARGYGVFVEGTTYLRFTFRGADGAGNQVSTVSELLPIHRNLLPVGSATTSPHTIVHEFPWAAWGDPYRWAGINGAFVGGSSLYPDSSLADGSTGAWNKVSRDFMRWKDPAKANAFNVIEVFLGMQGLGNLPEHPASSGTVQIKIYAADDTWSKGILVASSEKIPAASLFQMQNTADCMGYGLRDNPFTVKCLATFPFLAHVTLEADKRYVFELSAENIVTVTQVHNGTHYYPGFNIVGASVYSPPLWGLDGVQRSPNPNTGSVYMRLLDTGATPPPTGASSVLFLPGILTTELFAKNSDGSSRRIWNPTSNADVSLLALNADGTSPRDIYAGEIMDTISYGPLQIDVYKPFITFMDSLTTSSATSSALLKEWKAYPYDWRHDVRDVVSQGTLKSDGSRKYVDVVLKTLAASSLTGKVTIVAHSNGGLLAKALMLKLEQEGNTDLVDQIILVGSPQLGTPKTLGQMLHGDDLTKLLGIVMYGDTVRKAAATMPGMYGLLPSPKYFDTVYTPVADFTSTTLSDPYRREFGEAGLSAHSKMVNFITDTQSIRSTLSTTDQSVPLVLSKSLVERATATHALLDSWTPGTTTSIINIAGWGQETPSKYQYITGNSLFYCNFNTILSPQCGSGLNFKRTLARTQDGDNTVVSPSAVTQSSSRFYFNSREYENDNQVKINHEGLLSSPAIQEQVIALLREDLAPQKYISKTTPEAGRNPLLVASIHSPANLIATDNLGRKTGIVSISGYPEIFQIKEEIPGSHVEILGQEKYLYLPKNTSFGVVMKGYAIGTSTLKIGEISSEGVATTTQIFKNIITTPNTHASYSISSANHASNPVVDTNGDGKVDLILSEGKEDLTPVQTIKEILYLLRTKIQSLKLPTVLKSLLLSRLSVIESNLSNPQIYQKTLTQLEVLIRFHSGATLKESNKSLLELLHKLKK